MGLLTDAKHRQWLVRVILRYHVKLSFLLYVGGLAWFCALAYKPLNAGTYFSENALLPGLVESNLPQGFLSLHNYASSLKEEMNKDKKRSPKEWIYKQFQDLGLDTYRHNFTIKYPFQMAINKDLNGENLYAILRARRAASTEALVMMAPLRSASSRRTQTSGGIALMLGLAEQFRRNPYWAKDVIFLLTEYEEVGVLAWLDAYHESKSTHVMADDLPGRSGPIQAAINLEIPLDKVRFLNLQLEGLNGQLPNLDLVNLAVRLGRREHVHITLHKRGDHHDPESVDGFQHSLGTMLHMMWAQASGAPSASHGLFHRYHIEALTVEGVRLSKGMRNYSLDQLARFVEGIFRSLNNLLERFHQSFFFYILPSTDRYVSIGLYMPPFGLMVVAAVVKALGLWIIAVIKAEPEQAEEKEDEKKSEVNASGEDAAEATKEKQEETSGVSKPHNHDSKSGQKKSEELEGVEEGDEDDDDDEEEAGFELSETVMNVLSVLPVLIMSFLLGLLAYTAPLVMKSFQPSRSLRAEDIISYGIMAVFSAALTYPYLLNRKASPDDPVFANWHMLKCIGLLIHALTLFAVSLINISLAFFVGALTLPVMMMVQAAKSRVLKVLQLIPLLLVSPAGLLWLASVGSLYQKDPDQSALYYALSSVGEMKELLFLVLVDQDLLASWTYLLFSLAFLPAWLLFWAIPFCNV